jgi:hypothetical protein
MYSTSDFAAQKYIYAALPQNKNRRKLISHNNTIEKKRLCKTDPF